MLRFRHVALIFLFLSPAMAADEIPLEGEALLGAFAGDPDCAGGVKSDTCVLSFQLRGKAAKLLFDGLRDEAQKEECTGSLEKSGGNGLFCHAYEDGTISVNSAIPSRKMLSSSAPRTVDAGPTGRHSAPMSLARRLAFAVLGLALGASGGGVIGLLAGLAYTEIAGTSGFEGYSGFVVAFWIMGGITVGMIAGLVVAYRLARARDPEKQGRNTGGLP